MFQSLNLNQEVTEEIAIAKALLIFLYPGFIIPIFLSD